MREMLRKSLSIQQPSQVAVMVEGVSSKSPLLTSYFNHWEMRIYSTLRSMLSKNLRAVTDCIARATPLFTIDIRLSSPDIILLPSASEVRMAQHCFNE